MCEEHGGFGGLGVCQDHGGFGGLGVCEEHGGFGGLGVCQDHDGLGDREGARPTVVPAVWKVRAHRRIHLRVGTF